MKRRQFLRQLPLLGLLPFLLKLPKLERQKSGFTIPAGLPEDGFPDCAFSIRVADRCEGLYPSLLPDLSALDDPIFFSVSADEPVTSLIFETVVDSK